MLKRASILGVIGLISYACGGGDDSSSGSGTTTVTSGEQPDAQTGRFSAPPDTTAPTKLKAFSVAMGHRLGEILVVFGYPDATDDYARIDIRRQAGATEPADCASGTLAASITDFSTNTYADTGLFPGSFHSYLACLYDEADNLVAEKSLSTGRANDRQRMFVTSAQYDGNMQATFNGKTFTTGVEGADARCQYHADQAKLSGKWSALLSTSEEFAQLRAPIYAGVFNLKGERLAMNGESFWSGALENAVNYDENQVASEFDAWTGTSSIGDVDYGETCTDWTVTTGLGATGRPSTLPSAGSGGNWANYLTQTCSQLRSLYCIEKVDATFVAPTVTAVAAATVGDATVTVDFTSAPENASFVRIYRGPGASLLTPDCEQYYWTPNTHVRTFTGAESMPYADKTFNDVADSGHDGDEHGYYHYVACVLDTYGNVRKITTSNSVQLGTNFLRAFLTTATFTGATLTTGAANTACTNAASAASLTGTFKAYVSTNTVNAVSNIGLTDSTHIFDLDGNYVGHTDAGNNFDAYGTIRTTADGNGVDFGTRIWTGTSYSGTYSNSCSNWSTASASSSGLGGVVMPFVGSWASNNLHSCDQALRVACIEEN